MKKSFLTTLTLLGALLLQACVPAAFVAGAAAGVVVYENRSMKTMVQDQNIIQEGIAKINSDQELRDKAHIVITAFNHVALVVGQAPTTAMRDRALSLVQDVHNVSRIYNEVTIGEPTGAGTRSNDAWITTKVKTALLTKSGLRSSQIKILTENGTVYMLGLVTKAQADLAVDAAKTVQGVQKVVKLFEYIQ
jgi:osmotically-inducible protein OsmY